MAPQDTAAIAPTLQELSNKKIGVVSVDTRPDQGQVYMVVRADNRAYGQKACEYLGAQLKGKGKVVMFEGDLASINGRDRTEAFNACMKQKYPNVKVFGLATEWKGDVAAGRLAVPFPDRVSSRAWSYWLVYPTDRRLTPKIKRFREWLLPEIQRSLEDAAGGWPQPAAQAAE